MYFEISVLSKWYWQADLVWLTLLTWLFVHMKKVFFWVICLDCTSLPFYLVLLLLFSWCLGYRTACQGNKSRKGNSCECCSMTELVWINVHYVFYFISIPQSTSCMWAYFSNLKLNIVFMVLLVLFGTERESNASQVHVLIRLNPDFFWFLFPHMKLKYQQMISCKSRKDRKE